MSKLKKGDKVFFARILPPVCIYEVLELLVRTVNDEEQWFVGVDKRDKHAYLMSIDTIDTDVFFDRNKALKMVKKAEKENNKRAISFEKYYEEY